MSGTRGTGRLGAGPVSAAMRTSGVLGGVGFVFLVGMYAAFAVGARQTGMALGWVSDVSGVITLPLAIPGIIALHARLRPHGAGASDALLVVAIGATGAIAALQLLLVTGVLPFEQEIGPVAAAYIVMIGYFVGSCRMAERARLFRGGTLLGLAAGLMAGYPIWAFRVARAIEPAASTVAVPAG
jgi:hypothetical protein